MHLIKIENQPHLKGIKGEDLIKFFEKRKPSYIYIYTFHIAFAQDVRVLPDHHAF